MYDKSGVPEPFDRKKLGNWEAHTGLNQKSRIRTEDLK